MDDEQKSEDIIEEAEIIEEQISSEKTSDTASKEAASADTIISLEELIKRHISSIDKLRAEIKMQREMFDDAFINNPTYREESEKVKQVTKAKATIREQIIKQPAVMKIAQQLKDKRIDLKEKQMALSEYLREYQRLTGANEIEGEDGQVREIVNTATVVRKSSKYK